MQQVDLGATYTSGRLQWIVRALSTLDPGQCPNISGITLRLSVALSLDGPGSILGQEIRDDLANIGYEMVRIKKAYARKVNIVTRCDSAFKVATDSLVGEELLFVFRCSS